MLNLPAIEARSSSVITASERGPSNDIRLPARAAASTSSQSSTDTCSVMRGNRSSSSSLMCSVSSAVSSASSNAIRNATLRSPLDSRNAAARARS